MRASLLGLRRLAPLYVQVSLPYTHRSCSLVCAGLALVSSGPAPCMCGSRSRACAGLDPLCVRVSLSRTCWSHPRVGAGLAPVYAPVSLPWMCQTHSPVGAGTALVYARVSLPCRPRPRSRVCAGPAPSYVPVPLPGMCGFRPQVCAGPALVCVRVSLPCICLYRSLGCVDLDPLYVTVPTRVCAGSAPCVCPANSRACSGLAPSHVPVSLPCMPMFVRSGSPVCAGLDPVCRFRSPRVRVVYARDLYARLAARAGQGSATLPRNLVAVIAAPSL